VSRTPSRIADRTIEIVIDTLDDAGEGVATHAGQVVRVPHTLPGDRVLAQLSGGGRAHALSWVTRATHHAVPPCSAFGRCGGCTLQHLADGPYRAWKQDIARRTAARAGFPDAQIGALVVSPPATRRRATLAAVRSAAGPVLGFHAPGSNDIVDIARCEVLCAGLMGFVAPLRHALASVLAPAGRCDIALTWTATGIDAVVIGALTHAALAPLAMLPGLARLSRTTTAEREPELVALHAAPRIDFDGISLEPPPHVFLQATAPGEVAIRTAVMDGLGKARRVADLFAGCGTLALPLARTRQVFAIDTSAPALAALDRAARAAGLGPRLRVAIRDLARRPLIGDELADFDAVIFDPPREGAAAQADALAQSAVPRVVAVSCNPASFARDASLLGAGGYRLERITPIDQFLWSPHLELVGVFTRPRAGRPAPRR
jgi:23S rRNA (uracil1939-C5)-methyltransferase